MSAFFCGSPYAMAQKTSHDTPIINLHRMPQEKRDSILLAVSKEAVLRYGPGYYKDTHQTTIENLGIYYKLEGYEGLRLYKVTYIYDKNIEQLSQDYAAEVYVRSDSGRVIQIYFGNGWGLGGFDKHPDNGETELVIPYEQKHEMQEATIIRLPTVYYEVDSQGNVTYYHLDENGNQIPTDEHGNELSPAGSTKNTGDTNP